ncbi:MAG: hypothetical protein ACR5LD_11025 [Symbiopectobacterium sp.]
MELILTVVARQAIVIVLAKGEGVLYRILPPNFLVGIPPKDRHRISGWINAVLDYSDRQLGKAVSAVSKACSSLWLTHSSLWNNAVKVPGDDIVSLAISGELSLTWGTCNPDGV